MTYFENLAVTQPVASVILSMALMLLSGFLMTRLTKRLRLPDVTAYILAGILIGPYVLRLVPRELIDQTDFLSDIALAFIAFGTGEFFKLPTLRKNGASVIVITVLEACLASVLVFAVTYFLLHLELAFSIVLAALASATAPASTMMTIRQTGARGDFVDTLLPIVALDDVVGLIEYSVAISVASASMNGSSFDLGSVLKPIAYNLGILLLGGGFGWVLKQFMSRKHSTDNRLIIAIAALFTFCGLCAALSVSPLLGCMSMGMVYVNLTDDDKLFKQLNYFSPPILLLFFVRSGMSFRLDTLMGGSAAIGGVALLTVGALYFVTRMAGKYAGAYLGCLCVHKQKSVRNYLGLALFPQAGVAIGLAALGARTLGGDVGNDLQTIILASSVLYELIGPGCAKLALYLSHSYDNSLEALVPAEALPEPDQPKTPVELLIDRIHAISSALPAASARESEEEAAFLEAADEEYRAAMTFRRHPYLRRY